jgi:hypothetical protein
MNAKQAKHYKMAMIYYAVMLTLIFITILLDSISERIH